MELIVITLIFLFLFGSISLAAPSKKTKLISKLRLDAMKNGFKISSLKISTLEFKSRDYSNMVYQFKNKTNLKDAHFIRDKDGLILYSPLKLKYSEAYDGLEMTLNDLPYEVVEIIFTPSSISFLWNEKGGLVILDKVSETIKSIEL